MQRACMLDAAATRNLRVFLAQRNLVNNTEGRILFAVLCERLSAARCTWEEQSSRTLSAVLLFKSYASGPVAIVL